MKVLVINCGSSSVKYQLIDDASGKALHTGVVERIGHEGRTHETAVAEVLARVEAFAPEAVGHR